MRRHFQWVTAAVVGMACLTGGTSWSQTAREKLLQKEKEEKTTTLPPANPKQEITEAALDLSTNLNYRKLLTFSYIPSQRDPFISSTVISPFVTEEDLNPEKEIDEDTIKKAQNKIEKIIGAQVQIRGVSTGKLGAGFAVSETGQIIKPGEYLLVEIAEGTQQELEATLAIAQTAGRILQIRQHAGNIVLETKKVADKTVTFISPVSNTEEGEITVEYQKRIGFQQKLRPGTLENGGKKSEETPKKGDTPPENKEN
jgi:hypothetical protein